MFEVFVRNKTKHVTCILIFIVTVLFHIIHTAE